LRRRFGIPEDVTCFVFCAKFINKKHPQELLESFSGFVSAGGRAHLLMVGDGELRPACAAFAAEHKLPVTFAGFLNQSQIADAYLAGDCLVLPSDAGETWGLVVNEAMACGRPAIVSSLVGCAGDLIEPGRTGDVFRFGDWDGLAKLLADYARDGERLRVMGAQARERIELYSPEAAARGIVSAANAVTSARMSRALPQVASTQ
jgi:glycosyltransferase involved in cell wall biosynthesis